MTYYEEEKYVNGKKLTVSIILGIILSALLFTLLITINMFQIDYTIDSSHVFRLIGFPYLRVNVVNQEVEQEVLSGVIVVTGVIFSFLIFGGLMLVEKKRGKK